MNISGRPVEIYTINKGTERDTTFKIDTGGYVFSCLFDSGAEISCMNTETVAALGLIGQMTKSSVSVNTANGEDMGLWEMSMSHLKLVKGTPLHTGL